MVKEISLFFILGLLSSSVIGQERQYKGLNQLLEKCFAHKFAIHASEKILQELHKQFIIIIKKALQEDIDQEMIIDEFKEALKPLLEDIYAKTSFEDDLMNFGKENDIDLNNLSGTAKRISCWCALEIFYTIRHTAEDALTKAIQDVTEQVQQSVAEIEFKTEFLRYSLTTEFLMLQKEAITISTTQQKQISVAVSVSTQSTQILS